MLLYNGGQTATQGTYWNVTNGERIDVGSEASLPGNGRTRYVKMSGAMVLLAGPALGLIFALFLPFIGIAMTLGLIGRKLVGGAAQAAVKSSTFGWRPIEAYLNGRQRRKSGAQETRKEGKP